MIVLFEDNPLDFKSKVLAHSYSGNLSDIFKCGAGNVKRSVIDLLERTTYDVVAVIDLPVGNPNAYHMYGELRRLSMWNGNRLLCLPISCVEFYFIRSIVSHVLVKDPVAVNIAREAGYFRDTELAARCGVVQDSFEKYCKMVMKFAYNKCVNNSRDSSTCSYFMESCNIQECAIKDSVEIKQQRVADEFPWLPAEFGWVTHGEVSKGELFRLHCALVDMYNSMCLLYSSKDSCSKYMRVNYFLDWSK